MKILSCLALAIVASHSGQAQVQGQTPKFSGKPFLKGPIRLTPQESSSWAKLILDMQLPAPGTGLIANGSLFVGSFPDGPYSKKVFSSPSKSVEFVVGVEGCTSRPSAFCVQFATAPSSMSLTAPYFGWANPKGLFFSQDVAVSLQANPKNPADAALRSAPYLWGADLGNVKLGPATRYGYFNLSLPPTGQANGSHFYVRTIPIKTSGGVRTPVGPASNWVHVYVSVSEAEYAQKVADQKAQQAKKNAEAQGTALVTEANEARKALWNAYEIRLLSYIPPKFGDDADAANYFVANRGVSISYDGGKKATKLNSNETYSLIQVKNMLNSNKTWSQDMWDVLAATLNMASSGYKSAKGFAVNTLADGIDAIPGVNVSPEARAAMAVALDMALAYCGVPPNLPNIDELYGKGLDYMAATLADMAIEEATGIAIDDLGANATASKLLAEKAREPAKNALAGFLERVTKPAPFVADVPETWGYPAPFFRRHPAMLYLEIRRKPGAPLPIGQSWQGLELTFNNTFASIPQVLLPRTIEGKVRIPIALATIQGPEAWHAVGMMPEKNIDPAVGVGQPFYGDRGNTTVALTTTHRLGKSGAAFKAAWAAFSISSGYVNGRALPDVPIMMPGQSEAALEKPVVLGPTNYFGKVRVRWFEP